MYLSHVEVLAGSNLQVQPPMKPRTCFQWLPYNAVLVASYGLTCCEIASRCIDGHGILI